MSVADELVERGSSVEGHGESFRGEIGGTVGADWLGLLEGADYLLVREPQLTKRLYELLERGRHP